MTNRNVIRNSLFVFGVLVIAFLVSLRAQTVAAQPSSISVETTAVATTSVAFIGNGTATSTFQFDSYPTYSASKVFSMAGIDSVYLYVIATASSTATAFTFTPQFSNNGNDWYGFGSQGTLSGNNLPVSTTTNFTWTPGTVATTSMAFKLPDMSGLHERVVVSATGAAGGIYMEVVLKKNPSTP